MIYNIPEIEKIYEFFLESTGICTDTRKLKEGNLYFALVGDNFDGNNFAIQALENGASYAIISDDDISDERCFHVHDTLETLQHLANYHRKRLGLKIFAITGSNGKTTTKELCAAVLDSTFNIQFTQGNLNNHIGVPLTLLSFDSTTELGIVEMGANHLEEIASLCEIAEPNVGLITNIGKAHIGEFGGAENIKKAKLELFQFLRKNDGVFLFDQNDTLIAEVVSSYKNAIPYNKTSGNHYSIDLISNNPTLAFEYNSANKVLTFNLNLSGIHNEQNLRAAFAIGFYFGLDPDIIVSSLDDFQNIDNRSQWITSTKNRVFLDAYNANPTSVDCAIDYFLQLEETNKLCIIGDMFELGEYTQKEHGKVYEKLLSSGMDFYLVGSFFKQVAGADGRVYAAKEDLVRTLKLTQISKKVILIKASRSLALETLIEFL